MFILAYFIFRITASLNKYVLIYITISEIVLEFCLFAMNTRVNEEIWVRPDVCISKEVVSHIGLSQW